MKALAVGITEAWNHFVFPEKPHLLLVCQQRAVWWADFVSVGSLVMLQVRKQRRV